MFRCCHCPRLIGKVILASIVCFFTAEVAGAEVKHVNPKLTRADLYGDPLPAMALSRMGVMHRPGRPYTTAAVSPDGSSIITGEEGRCRFWDLASGKQLWSLELEEDVVVNTIIFSPDRKRFAICAKKRKPFAELDWISFVYVGETATGALQQQFRQESELSDLRFAQDGGILMARKRPGRFPFECDLVTWDVASARQLRLISDITCESCSPDRKFLAVGKEDGSISLLETDSGRKVHQWQGDGNKVLTITFSPDGKLLACRTRRSVSRRVSNEREPTDAIRVWDFAARKELWHDKARPAPIRTLAFSPDSQTLITSDGNGLRLWDSVRGDQFAFLPVAPRWVLFSPDSKKLIWTEVDNEPFHEWDLALKKETRRWGGAQGPIANLGFSPDGKLLISAGYCLCVWDFRTAKVVQPRSSHVAPITSLVFSPNGKFLGSMDSRNGLGVWEIQSGKPLISPLCGPQGPIVKLAFLADSNTLVAVGNDATVRVFGLPSGNALRTFSVGSPALGRKWKESHWPFCGSSLPVVFSPGRDVLAVLGDDQSIGLWDLATGKELHRLRGHRGQHMRIMFAPDGKTLLSQGDDWTIRLWDVPTGKEIQCFHVESKIDAVPAFSSDSALLAWASDGTIHVFNLSRRRAVQELVGHKDRIGGLAFLRDSRLLVSHGWDRAIRTWDTTTGKVLSCITEREKDDLFSINLHSAPSGEVFARISSRRTEHFSFCEVDTGIRLFTCYNSEDPLLVFNREVNTLVIARKMVAFREFATGGELPPLPTGHQDIITQVSFSPDGKTVVTGSRDGTILTWDWRRVVGLTAEPGSTLRVPERDTCWDALAGLNAAHAYQAIGKLAAGKDRTVAFLSKHMRPATALDRKRVQQLLAELDHNDFTIREKARQALEQLGSEVQPLLRQALAGELSLDARRTIEALVLPPELQRCSPAMLRQRRAIQTLELIGTPRARRLLETLATGVPQAPLTQRARAALARLNRTP